MRSLLALGLVACAHQAPLPVVARRPPPAPVVIPTTTDDDTALLKLPDYQPMRSFLEKTSPTTGRTRDVYITLNPTEAPMSLERRTIETAAKECFLEVGGSSAELTVTLDTREDGTVAGGSIDNTSVPLGNCLMQRLVKVPLHEEGRREHIVVGVTATFSSMPWDS